MATARHHPVPQTLLMIIGIGAVVLMASFGIARVVNSGNASFPATRKLTASDARPTTSPAPSYRAPAGGSVADPDGRFIDLAAQNGYPVRDRGQMITAAQQVCAMVSAGTPVAAASRTLVVGYGLTRRQAAVVGDAAIEVYCPENRA